MLRKRCAGADGSGIGRRGLGTSAGPIAAMAALVLAGCAETGTPGPRPLKPLEIATVPYVRVSGESLTGSLAYEGECLLFQDDNSDRKILPAWPTGSVFNGTSLIFHAPGKTDQPIVIAQHFVMTGQTLGWSDLPGVYYGRFQQKCGGEPFRVSEVRPAD